jgi:hypothetical protein
VSNGEDEREAERVRRIRTRSSALPIVVVASTMLAVGLVALLFFVRFRPGPTDPLRFPVSTMDGTVQGVQGPAVRAGDDARTTVVNCVKGKKAVVVSGTLYWQTVDPPGTRIPALSGSAPYQAGCNRITSLFAMPKEVRDRDAELRRQGHAPRWVLLAVVTPEGGGVTRTWQTEPFQIVQTTPGT